MSLADTIRFGADGLVPAAITDHDSGRLLVLCFLNREALDRTLADGHVHLYRRSKGTVQKKGTDSGHVQRVRQVRVNCDLNSLEIRVEQTAGACHAGFYSCFYRRWDAAAGTWVVDDEQVFDPDEVYS